MAFIQGGVFMMGGDNDQAREDEFPKHKVQLNSFFIDKTEVTNSSLMQGSKYGINFGNSLIQIYKDKY
jgi:hypothetical protein